MKATETALVWDWARAQVLVTGQASDPELERDLAQAMATAQVKALAQQHVNLNRRNQLPKIKWE